MHAAAVFCTDANMLEQLYEPGLDVSDKCWEMPLHNAARFGNATAAAFLADKSPVNVLSKGFNIEGELPMELAAMSNEPEQVIRKLVGNDTTRAKLLSSVQRSGCNVLFTLLKRHKITADGLEWFVRRASA